MTLRESVPLSTLTTLRVGGAAQVVIDIDNVAELPEAISDAKERGLPVRILGEGSNVLAADEGYGGVIIRLRTQERTFTDVDDETVLVRACAGVVWDTLVTETTNRGLWGIENLAGIPGTVGAAPVQNIGAYGTECASVIEQIDVFDCATGATAVFFPSDCGFQYRESRFKHERNLIITAVTFRLSRTGSPQIGYSDLARRSAEGEALDTPARIAEAVRAIRARKFPDLSKEGSAGSFFKNPIIREADYEALVRRFAAVIAEQGALPRYPLQRAGEVKIPLAYILDKVLGLRGHALGRAHLFSNQPLVLVTEAGATAHDVNQLADDVARRVYDATGLTIEREVQSLG